MKLQTLLFSLALLAACSSQNNGATSNASETAAAPPPAATLVAPVAAPTASDSMPAMAASASMPMADQSDSKTPSSVASATGVVKAVDPLAKTITLDHGPVDALHWPAMVMTFKTGDVDVASIKPGDHVVFEFTSNGMDGTLTKIDRQ